VQRQAAYLSVQRHHESTDLSLSSHVEIGNLRNTFNHQTDKGKSVYLPSEKIPHT